MNIQYTCFPRGGPQLPTTPAAAAGRTHLMTSACDVTHLQYKNHSNQLS